MAAAAVPTATPALAAVDSPESSGDEVEPLDADDSDAAPEADSAEVVPITAVLGSEYIVVSAALSSGAGSGVKASKSPEANCTDIGH